MSKKYEELDFTDDFFFCKILMKTSLDVYIEDDAKTVYDIEMQPTMQKNLPKRSRYYQGMIDLNLIERGADYKELKKSFVIFICLSDPFKKGLHIYTFENQCKESPDLLLGDETTKVFINAAGTTDDVSKEMKDFLDYLLGKGTKNDFTRRIDNEVTKARTHEEWKVEYMSLILRDHEKRAEGREETRRAVVVNMLKDNEPIDKICRYAECDEAFVLEVKTAMHE